MTCNFSPKPLMGADSICRLEQVTRRFDGGVTALENITLDVVAGEITALIGASGSGKTTLLRLVAGLDAPSAGRITFSGAPACAYVFQQPALLPWASVRDNIALPAQLGASAAAIEELLAQVGLTGKAERLPHELSGGQQMRVSIARALASTPDVLLMDEPFAALDEITRQKLCDLLVEIAAAQKLSVMFVTHNISEAVYVAQQVVLLTSHPGTIAAQLEIHAPTPRRADFRSSESYAQQCAALSAKLAQVMA
jgi:NitT/TauT family transport system ATP-binding protein